MVALYVPRGIGALAMEELSLVDWTLLRHAYGTGRVTYLGSTHDVEATLLALASEDDSVHAETMTSVFSMLCHQGYDLRSDRARPPLLDRASCGLRRATRADARCGCDRSDRGGGEPAGRAEWIARGCLG